MVVKMKNQVKERKMNMKNRLMSLLLIAVLVITGTIPAAFAKVAEVDEIIYQTNFETDDYLTTSTMETQAGFKGWGNWDYVTPGSDGTGRCLRIGGASDGGTVKQINLIFASRLSTGTYKAEMDFYPSVKANYFGASHQNNTYNRNLTLPAVVTSESEVTGDKILRQWYRLELKLNLDTNSLTGTLTKDGKTYWTQSADYSADLRSFSIIPDGNVSDADRPCIDNLELSKVTTETYELTADNVTITDKAGVVQSDLASVNPSLQSIAIDFGKDMKEETLTDKTVTLITGTTEVDCTRAYADGVYTLTPEANLNGGADYTLNITDAVAYETGVNVDSLTVEFTTVDLSGSGSANIYETDFETDDYLTDAYAGAGYKGWGSWGWGTGSDGTGRSMRITGSNNGSNVKQVNLIFGTSKLTTGIYKATMDFYPSTKGNYFGASHIPNNYYKNITLPAVVTSESEVTGDKILRQWYKLELKLNIDTDVFSASLTKDGKTYWSSTANYSADLWSFQIIPDGSVSDAESALIDNLVLKQVFEISKSSISMTDKMGTPVTDYTNVSPAIGSIAVNLDTGIKEDTLNDKTIILTDGTTSVECLRSYENGVYTLTPQANLSEKTKYTLTLTSGIRNDSGISLDEISVEFTTGELAAAVIDYPDYIWAEDFEDYADTKLNNSNFTLNGAATHGFAAWGYWNTLDGYGYEGKGFVLAAENARATTSVSFITGGTEFTTGMYRLTAKYMPSTQVDKITVSDYPNVPRNYITLPAVSSEYERKWYDLDILVNLDSDNVTVTITDGSTEVFKQMQDYTRTLRDIKLQMDSSTGSSITWSPEISLIMDNVKVGRAYTVAPVFANSNVVPYAATYAQTDMKNVSSLTDRIEIALPQQIKASTLTADNITLTKKSDGSAVDSTVMYNHDSLKYVMNLDEMLTPGAEYILTIKNLENVSGIAMAEPFVLNFTAGAKETKASLNKLTQNSVEVTKASLLIPGAEATVEIDYQNSTGEAVNLHLIFAFYRDDELLKADYITKLISEDVMMTTYKLAYDLPLASEISGYDRVKVMLWDGFSSMLPLSDSLELVD